MKDEKKTKKELLAEVETLRRRVNELETFLKGPGEAAAALRENEDQFRNLAEKSPNMIFINSGGRIVYANERCTEVMGYTRDEFYGPGFDFMCLISPESADAIRASYASHAKGGDVPPFEYGLLTKSGEKLNAILTTKLITYNGSVGILGIVTDVTDRKRAEESLRESEERYRAIFEQAADTIMLLDAENGAVVEFNDIAYESLGYTRQEFSGLRLSDIEANETAEEVAEHMEMVAREGIDHFETMVRTKRGELRNYQVSATAVTIRGKTYIQVVGRDVTDQMKAQEELKRSFAATQKILDGTVDSLAVMAEQKDPYTAGHQRAVGQMCREIAWEMRLDDEQIRGVSIAGILHDIGKISIPTEIITKPSRLTEVEYALVKTHSRVGYNILASVEFPWPVARIVLEHHERMNGSGYPNGLSESNTLLESRILAVADVVEAMSADRPYRPACEPQKIIDEIQVNKGILYDPNVVDACMRLIHLGKIRLD